MVPRKDNSGDRDRLPASDNLSFTHSSDSNDKTVTDFIDPVTGRHLLDALYETFAKPQLSFKFTPTEPSIYIRHEPGQMVDGEYKIEKIFEHPSTGFYAESRVPLSGKHPPVLVIRGYGSWYPFERVIEDTPDVFIARMERQLKAAEKCGAVDWLKQQCENGQKADITGESLGGKVAQQIAAKYPDCFRSTVTFNPLGVSQKTAKTSTAKNVFHYFTLGEKYAFWANGGDYIPGNFFQISKKGQSLAYRIEQAIVRRASFHVRNRSIFHWLHRTVRVFLIVIAQLILLKRHNEMILNRRSAKVVKIDRDRLPEIGKRWFV